LSAAGRLRTPEHTSGGAGFVDGNAMQERELRFEALPEPASDVFAGGVFEAGDLVEVVVIELVFEGLEDLLDVTEVHEPAGVRIDGAAEGEVDFEGVAVEAGAFVGGGNLGEAMSGFEGEGLGKFDDEGLLFALGHVQIVQKGDEKSLKCAKKMHKWGSTATEWRYT
jgi:hypothetical protein